MEQKAITIYVLCDEVLKGLGHTDDPQCAMSSAEIMAFALLSATYFQGNMRRTRLVASHCRWFSRLLSNSRINRRIHAVPEQIWTIMFRLLSLTFKEKNTCNEYAVDSFPLACCQKPRIDRRRVFLGKQYIGYAASKKRHFCGLRVHMIVTCAGEPIELQLQPASENDLAVLWKMELDLPAGSRLYADGAYTAFYLEDFLREEQGLELLAKRGKHHQNRRRSTEEERTISSKRQIVETAFSCITDMLPRNIRCRTEKGFKLKAILAVIAYGIGCLGSR